MINSYNNSKGLYKAIQEKPFDPDLRGVLGINYNIANGGDPEDPNARHLYTGVPADAAILDAEGLFKKNEKEIKKTITYDAVIKAYDDPHKVLEALTSLPALKGNGEIAKAHQLYLKIRDAYEGRASFMKNDPEGYIEATAQAYGEDGPQGLIHSGAEYARRVDHLSVVRAEYALYKAIEKVKPEPKKEDKK